MTSPASLSTPTPRILVLGHHDVDGVVSAARLATQALKDWPTAEVTYVSVDFHLSSQWPNLWERIARGEPILGAGVKGPFDGVVIADFPMMAVPPHVRVWFADHHPNPVGLSATPALLLEDMQRRRTAGECSLHEARSSCGALLRDHLPLESQHPEAARWETLLQMADHSDRALYRSMDPTVDPVLAADLLIEALSPEAAGDIMKGLARGAQWNEVIAPWSETALWLVEEWQKTRVAVRERTRHIAPSVVIVPPSDDRRPQAGGLRLAKFLPYAQADVNHALVFDSVFDGTDYGWRGTLGRRPNMPPPPPGMAWPHLGRVIESLGLDGGGHGYAAGVRLWERDGSQSIAAQLQSLTDALPSVLVPVTRHHPLADIQTLSPLRVSVASAGDSNPSVTQALRAQQRRSGR